MPKVVIKYVNAAGKVDDEMTFYITRESEQNKQQLKNYVVFNSIKIS